MIKKVFQHWKNNRRELTIIILGYVITILVISMFIGDIQNRLTTYSQQNFGNEDKRTAIHLHSDRDKTFGYDVVNLIKYLGKSGAIDILNVGKETLFNESKKAQGDVTPVYYESEPDWQPMLYKGRNLTPSECTNNSKSIVIGINIANALSVNVNDKVKFYNTEYKVIGIFGRKNLSTNFDDTIYIPVGALPNEYKGKLEQKLIKQGDNINFLDMNILIRVNSNDMDSLISKLEKHFNQNTFSYETFNNFYETMSFNDLIMGILIICVPIMVVALINVTNISMLWIVNRKKELCIKKVLGATDVYIKKSIEADMIIVAGISAIIACIVQEILYCVVEPAVTAYRLTFNFTWINFIIAVIVSFIIGYLASIIPFEKTIDMNVADVLKTE